MPRWRCSAEVVLIPSTLPEGRYYTFYERRSIFRERKQLALGHTAHWGQSGESDPRCLPSYPPSEVGWGPGLSHTHIGLRGAGLLPCSLLWRSCSRSGSPVVDPARCGRLSGPGAGVVDRPRGREDRGASAWLPRFNLLSGGCPRTSWTVACCGWTPLGSPPPQEGLQETSPARTS